MATALEFPLGFDLDEMVDDSLADTCTLFDDNYMSSIAQVQLPEKSPFHESDSGVSDITGVSSGSPQREADTMLSELVDNKPFTPFGFHEDVDEPNGDLMKYLQQQEQIDVTGCDTDIDVLLSRTVENGHVSLPMSSENMNNQKTVRQRRGFCESASGTAAVLTRKRAGRHGYVSSDSSLASDYDFELDKDVPAIDDDSTDFDAVETGDDDEYRPMSFEPKRPKGSVRIQKPGTPVPRQPKSLSNIRCVATDPAQSSVASVKVLQVVRATAGQNTADEVVKALEDRNRKNAEAARVNRQRKKAYIQGLEGKLAEANAHAEQLQKRLQVAEAERESWKKENEYLKAVLANQSALAGLLKNIPGTKGVSLSSSVLSSKRSAEMDHSYTPNKKQCSRSLSTAGVCLHVDNDNVSLEFCHHCAQKAKGTST